MSGGPSPRDLRLRLTRLPPGQVKGRRDEGVQLRVELFRPADQRVDQLHRRELARRDEARSLGEREVVQGGRHVAPILRHGPGHRQGRAILGRPLGPSS